MKKENSEIFKKIIRQRRAISSNIWENGSYNETEEDRSKSKNSKKSFHRKTSSSYFYGSYLSSNLNELLNNLNIDELTNNKENKEEKTLNKKEKDKKFIDSVNFFDSNINQENNSDVIYNVSFHSYDLDKSTSENNTINKNEENKKDNNIKNNNNKFIENTNSNENKLLIDNKENKSNNEKSFLSFKNNLKYIKDKEERATKSYLLALGMTTKQNKKEEKEPYLPTTSIIEEEKSDLIESKSEFSNKKISIVKNYFFEDPSKNKNNVNKIYYIKKENKIKNNNDNPIINSKKDEKEHFINVNRNYNIGRRNEKNIKEENTSFKISVALNEIINKKNKKEENKRKNLKKNKTILLNSFFMTYKGNMIKGDIMNNNKINNKKNEFKKTENNNIEENKNRKIESIFPYFQKRKSEKSYIYNLMKKRFNTENSDSKNKIKNNNLNKKEKKNFLTHRSEKRNIKYNYLNNSINSNININKANTIIKKENKLINTTRPFISKIEYKLRAKIPHLRQKIIDKKGTNGTIKNNYINNYTFGKNNTSNKKFLTKIVNIPHKKNYSFTKDKIIFNDRDNNLHSKKQIKTINEALALIRIQRMNSKKLSKAHSKNNKTKNSNSSSFTGATRSNSKSSRSKENNIVLNKTNYRLSYSISSS